MVKSANVAVIIAVIASCDAARPRVASTTQNECTECKDPEDDKKAYYVSIGIMPSPYPIDWTSPNTMYATTLLTSALGAPFKKILKDPLHTVGHAMLKVQCGEDVQHYISQTGAVDDPKDPLAQFRELQRDRVNMLFRTWGDGFLDPNGQKDWEDQRAAQKKLTNGVYQLALVDDLAGSVVALLANELTANEKAALKAGLTKIYKDLKAVARHRFVRATILVTKEQCQAILDWKKAYADSGGPARYGIHRAPWIVKDGKYDGGACGTVSFAGAFYASGLDYKKAAEKLALRKEIGTARLTKSIVREKDKPEGWYVLQDEKRYVPGPVPCAEANNQCKAKSKTWFDPLYDKWNGAEDDKATFSKSWGTGANVDSTTIPLIAIEPEKFYQEILARLNNANHPAFGHGPWCKIDKGGVPVIVLDGTGAKVGRPMGIDKGFDTANAKLF